MMNPKPSLYVFAALGYLPVLVFAVTPTVTGVAGSILTGQKLTINGTSMVQEDRTNWDPMFINNPNSSGFEGASLAADGYGTYAGQWLGSPEGTSYDTTIKLMGNQSVKTHLEGEHIRTPTGGAAGAPYWWTVQANQVGNPFKWTDVYFRVYSRWNANSWPTIDEKFWWMLNGSAGYFWSFRPDGTGAPHSVFGVYSPTDPFGDWWRGNIPGGPLKNNRWYLIEGHARMDGSSPNYVLEVWFDNQLIISAQPAGGLTSNGQWESNTNMDNTPVGWLFDMWQDGLAVSKSRIGPASLIEIGNCSTYTSGTKVYQAPEFLSDTSSQIQVDLSGLGAGPYVLWVTNNRNERSLPFALGTGTPSCAAPVFSLSSPLNLRVQ